jgi:hypothetical protein
LILRLGFAGSRRIFFLLSLEMLGLGCWPVVGGRPSGRWSRQKDDFYLNLGLAVQTLREDLPLLFTKDLNYDIYRLFSLLGVSYYLGLLYFPGLVFGF